MQTAGNESLSLIPKHQIRATFDDAHIVVYQAFSPAIARAAVSAGTFVAPFKRERMTWIKPSFLWMMYRSGWATKPGQTRVLAIKLRRDGFEWALAHSCLSHYDLHVYRSYSEWIEKKAESPVVIQWDPERSIQLQPLTHRSLQIGLGADVVEKYVDEWIVDVEDVTSMVSMTRGLVDEGKLEEARAHLPTESEYPLSTNLKAVIGAS